MTKVEIFTPRISRKDSRVDMFNKKCYFVIRMNHILDLRHYRKKNLYKFLLEKALTLQGLYC